MGSCPSTRGKRTFINQKVSFEHSTGNRAELLGTPMNERSNAGDFNSFLELQNGAAKIAKQWFEKASALSTENHDLKKQIQSLRQRIGDDSEMDHRCYQSSSEDITSRNKRSDVVKKFKRIDGAPRRQAIEAFGKPDNRSDLWYRKDVTCRIFVVAHDVAKSTKSAFAQSVLPKFFQCAPSLGVIHQTKGSNSPEASELFEKGMQESISREMDSLFLGESFQVACSSVLKEMAVSCDLTALEEKTVTELKKFRDQWRKEDPLLPYLDDNILLKMKNFIAECVQISWRMVNQLPPIKITQANKVHGERFEEFFEMEEEEVTERASTVTICVWPALTDSEGDEVLAKGKAAIIPRSQTHTFV